MNWSPPPVTVCVSLLSLTFLGGVQSDLFQNSNFLGGGGSSQIKHPVHHKTIAKLPVMLPCIPSSASVQDGEGIREDEIWRKLKL